MTEGLAITEEEAKWGQVRRCSQWVGDAHRKAGEEKSIVALAEGSCRAVDEAGEVVNFGLTPEERGGVAADGGAGSPGRDCEAQKGQNPGRIGRRKGAR